MKWSTRPYELFGVFEDCEPMEVEGTVAAVMRSLDAYGPLGADERNTMTDYQTRLELLNYLGDFRWCDGLGRAVVRDRLDMYRLADEGELRRAVEDFLGARVVWARNALRIAEAEEANAGAAKAYLAFARKQDTAANVERLAKAMRSQRPVEPDRLDREPNVIGTPSGVMSLDTGELFSERDDWLAMAGIQAEGRYTALAFDVTKRVRGELGSDFHRREFAHDPRWQQFIDEICDGDAAKASFLQRALGYSLYGGNPEKATFVLWGPKRDNGKSTLMNVVKHVMGDYADEAPSGLLLVNRFENYTAANPVLAKLVGKRLVDVSEPPLGAELNGAMVKKLASGTDAVSTRHLNRDEFSYVPQFTLWMHCNALPVVRDPSAIDPEHMFVIEFTRSFTGDERDMTLTDRFKTPDGMHTVLSWLVRGYLDYRERGLDAPDSVKRATGAWLETSGTWLDRFIQEFCVINASESCLVEEFKEAAFAYCDEIGADRMGMKAVNAYLRQLNVINKPSHGKRFYRGIGLVGQLPQGEQDGCSKPPEKRSAKCSREESGGNGGKLRLS